MVTSFPYPSAPGLFDCKAVRWRRIRAAGIFSDHDFLWRRARDEISDRILATHRDFTCTLEWGGGGVSIAATAAAAKTGYLLSADCAPELLPQSLPGASGNGLVADFEPPLPIMARQIDAMVAYFTLHRTNDLLGALTQIYECLRPHGLFLAAMAGEHTLHELRFALAHAEAEISGGARPRVAPFPLLPDMGQALQRAGFARPVVDRDRLVVLYRDIRHLCTDLRGMGETNTLTERARGPLPRAVLRHADVIYRRHFAGKNGKIAATFDIFYLAGWRR